MCQARWFEPREAESLDAGSMAKAENSGAVDALAEDHVDLRILGG